MPLPQYGVAIGTFVSFARDPQDQYGRWYHGHLTIQTPLGAFTSALDVDTPTGLGVSFRESHDLAEDELGPVATLPAGWHALASTPTSGAIDYLRSPFLQDVAFTRTLGQLGTPLRRLEVLPPVPPLDPEPPPGPDDGPPLPFPRPPRPPLLDPRQTVTRALSWLGSLLPWRPFVIRPWVASTGDNALSALEGLLAGSTRVYLFGEHFEHTGNGVHDVHQNQGDPAGSQWWASDGVWQDGAVFVRRPNGKLYGWQVRFNSQSMHTDGAGHPV